jgi:hypothetical protein
MARTVLKETPKFLKQKENSIKPTKFNMTTMLAYFLMMCGWPVCFYFAYIHCSSILKNSYGYKPEEIIHHNFILSIISLISYSIFTYLSYKIYPLIILKIKLAIFCIFIVSCPYLLDHYKTPFALLLIQLITITFGYYFMPASPIFFQHIPKTMYLR